MLAAVAAAIHCALYFTGALSTGWSILVATLASSILIEIIYAQRGKTAETMYVREEEV